MPDPNTVSVEAGSTAVYGYLTSFVGYPGDTFNCLGRTVPIEKFVSTSEITLAYAWPVENATDTASWSLMRTADAWSSNVKIHKAVNDLIEKTEGGLPVAINAGGPIAKRALYDAAAEGFTFLEPPTELDGRHTVYVKLSDDTADWSVGATLQGGVGPAGKDGSNWKWNAQGPAADRGAYDSRPVGFSYFATDEAMVYVREGEIGEWSPGVAFPGAGLATKPEAVAGESNEVLMTPKTVHEAVPYVKLAGSGGVYLRTLSDMMGDRIELADTGRLTVNEPEAATENMATIAAAMAGGQSYGAPRGTVYIDDTIYLSSNGQSLMGHSRFKTVFRNDVNDKLLMGTADLSGPKKVFPVSCTIQGFTLHGNPTSKGGLAAMGRNDDEPTGELAARAFSVRDIRVTSVGDGPGVRQSAWKPHYDLLEIWLCKQGLLIGSQVYSMSSQDLYISSMAEWGIFSDAPSSLSRNLDFLGTVVQHCGDSRGQIVMLGTGVTAFHGLYMEGPNVGTGAFIYLRDPGTNFSINGLAVTTGNIATPETICVIDTDVQVLEAKNVQIASNIGNWVKVSGNLPRTVLQGWRQTSGTTNGGRLVDTSTGKLTWKRDFGPEGRQRGDLRVLAASAVPQSTASTTETTLETIPVPAGVLGANGFLEIEATFESTADATVRIRFGANTSGTAIVNESRTGAGIITVKARIQNAGSVDSQSCATSSGVYALTVPTGANNTNIYLRGNTASTGTMKLLSFTVKSCEMT